MVVIPLHLESLLHTDASRAQNVNFRKQGRSLVLHFLAVGLQLLEIFLQFGSGKRVQLKGTRLRYSPLTRHRFLSFYVKWQTTWQKIKHVPRMPNSVRSQRAPVPHVPLVPCGDPRTVRWSARPDLASPVTSSTPCKCYCDESPWTHDLQSTSSSRGHRSIGYSRKSRRKAHDEKRHRGHRLTHSPCGINESTPRAANLHK